MIKARSWIELWHVYVYFKNGMYSFNQKEWYGRDTIPFNWEKEEQELATNIFENDILEFSITDKSGHSELYNGTVAIEDYKAVVQCNEKSIDLWEALIDGEHKVIGNIREANINES